MDKGMGICAVCGEPYDHVHVAGQSDLPKEEETMRLDTKIYKSTLKRGGNRDNVPISIHVDADGSIKGIYTEGGGGSAYIGSTVSVDGALAESLIDFCIDVAANLPNTKGEDK